MCMKKFVVQRQMLGTREQGWSLWNGKEIVEMTSNEIKKALRKNEEIYGLVEDVNGNLVVDSDNFYCRNVMEHRQVNNYEPMLKIENPLVNLFYIVMGKTEDGLYEVVSSRFERTTLSEDMLKMYYQMNIISAGAKVDANGCVVLPEMNKLAEKPEPEVVEIETSEPVEEPASVDEFTGDVEIGATEPVEEIINEIVEETSEPMETEITEVCDDSENEVVADEPVETIIEDDVVEPEKKSNSKKSRKNRK